MNIRVSWLIAAILLSLPGATAAPQDAPSLTAAPDATPTAPAAATAAAPLSGRTVVFPLRGHGTLELVVPRGFTHAITQPPGNLPPRLWFAPAGATTRGFIAFMLDWEPRAIDAPSSSLATRAVVDALFADIGASKREAPAQVHELPDGKGLWWTVSDPTAPRKGAPYPWATGVASCAFGACVTCFVVAPEEQSEVASVAFELVRTMRIREASGHGASAAPIPAALAVPDAPWQVRLDLPPHYAVDNAGLAEDDIGPRIRAGDEASGVSVTAYGGRVTGAEDAATLRDRIGDPEALAAVMRGALRSKRVEVRDRRAWDEGDHAWLAYAAITPNGRAHRSMHLVLVHDGSWIMLHASKAPAVPADDAVLEAILRTARIDVP